jgi:hypothetical protein
MGSPITAETVALSGNIASAILRSSSRVSAWPQCLLYSRKRTSLSAIAMSALCHKRTERDVSVMSER